jgi:hypothetical protein
LASPLLLQQQQQQQQRQQLQWLPQPAALLPAAQATCVQLGIAVAAVYAVPL